MSPRQNLKSALYGDISVEEVSLALENLKPGKASGTGTA